VHGPDHAIRFFHGYTYSGHPLACAAGLAALDTYARGLLTNRTMAATFANAHSLRDEDNDRPQHRSGG
jgi:beta-alanine--pyruvate transaminase